jgi:DNA repair exonuclease SbcCD ATPase subunit
MEKSAAEADCHTQLESAAEADFHTPSEYMKNVSREENSPDQTVLNTRQETKEVVELDAGKDAAPEAATLHEKAEAVANVIQQMPQNKLEEIAGSFLYFAAQDGILSYSTIAGGNTSEILNKIVQRFREMKEAEEMCVVLEAQMVGLQARAEELLAQKDDDALQEIEQIRAECRDAIAEQQEGKEEAEKANEKIKRKLRSSAGEVVDLLEKIRQLEAEKARLEAEKAQLEAENDNLKFADCNSEPDRVRESMDECKKFRSSLGGGGVERSKAKASEMAMAFRMATNVMTTNISRDKEVTEGFRTIQEIVEELNIEKGNGWLASEKLKAADRQMIELELTQYAEKTGRAKLTKEKAKDWCNVCRIFIEALGHINLVMQRGGLTNMFRSMVDQGGSIKAGIEAPNS